MKIVFHPRYTEVYASDPAASTGRLDYAIKELEPIYGFIKPEPATDADIALVHSPGHIEHIKRDKHLYELSALAAGGAIRTAQLAADGEPSFGLIRPPGHHASPDSCWGFCFFNNMSIAIKHLQATKGIKRVFILDFDMHTGDGNINCLEHDPNVVIYNPSFPGGNEGYVNSVEQRLRSELGKGYDIISASAGFDNYVQDWGGLLTTDDFHTIGAFMKDFAQKECHGRRFAILEGGYNHQDLGKNIRSFLEGMS